jgi:type VI protein secretion system component Hcp
VNNGEAIMSNERERTIDELADIELDAVTGGKLIDAATPKLHEAASKGTHLPEVVLHLY